MSKDKRQPLIEIVSKEELEEELTEMEKRILAKIERRTPRLRERDLEAIAEKVAAHIVEWEMGLARDEVKSDWKQRLAKLGYDVGIGLLTSGAWAAIVYGACHVHFADGESRSEEQLKEARRLNDIGFKIAQELSPDEFHELGYLVSQLKSAVMHNNKLSRRVFECAEFQEFRTVADAERRRKGHVGYGGTTFSANVFSDEILKALIEAVQSEVAAR